MALFFSEQRCMHGFPVCLNATESMVTGAMVDTQRRGSLETPAHAQIHYSLYAPALESGFRPLVR